MSIEEKKEKLLKKEISVSDLTHEEVEEIKKSIEKDIELKNQELNKVNEKIKELKVKIDNLSD